MSWDELLEQFKQYLTKTESVHLFDAMGQLEEIFVKWALDRTRTPLCGVNKAQAAKLLKINRTTLVEKMKKMCIHEPARFRKMPPEIERQKIVNLLNEFNNDTHKVARFMHLSHIELCNKMRNYNLLEIPIETTH